MGKMLLFGMGQINIYRALGPISICLVICIEDLSFTENEQVSYFGIIESFMKRELIICLEVIVESSFGVSNLKLHLVFIDLDFPFNY